MQHNDLELVLSAIKAHAVGALGERSRTTNLYLDEQPRNAGDVFGPAFQGLRAPQPCFVVFADDEPLANFGHACRYFCYDSRSGQFLREYSARFPPYTGRIPATLRTLHAPVTPLPGSVAPVLEITKSEITESATRNRYAILFSGASNRRHLNDLEYCYRMLTDRYGFLPDAIQVLHFDGTLSFTEAEPATNWPMENADLAPEDRDPYRIRISGKGDGDGFRDACERLAETLQPEDLVFIHTTGHGDAIGSGAFLVQHNSGQYFAQEFCTDLSLLSEHHSMLIMMEQCFSGGFIPTVVQAQQSGQINASQISIACASERVSFMTPDGAFDSFALGWIASHAGLDPYGNALVAPVDQNQSGFTEADEAYAYAELVKHANDQPVEAHSPDNSAAAIRLA